MALPGPNGGGSSVTVDSAAGVNGPACLALASNGNVIIFYNAGGIDNNGQNAGIYYRISTDGGASWSARTLLDTPTNGTSRAIPGRPAILANGDIVLMTEEDTNAKIISATGDCYCYKATNNGTNWSANTPITRSGFTIGIPVGHIIQVTNGDLWQLWAILRTGDTAYSTIIMVCPSGSEPTTGSNWVLKGGSIANATVMRDAAQLRNYDEADIVMVSSTRFLAFSRDDPNNFLNPRMAYSISTDSGATWTAPAILTTTGGQQVGEGVSPALIKLTNGDILLSYGDRSQFNGNVSTGMTISKNGGASWSNLVTYVESAGTPTDGNGPAYSAVIQLANGKLLAAYFPMTGIANAAILYTNVFDEAWLLGAPLVQSAIVAYPASTSSRTIALRYPVTAHNTLICIVGTFDITNITLNDNLGNGTWPQIGTPAANGNNVMNAFWVFDSLSGACTVTINNPSVSNGFITAVLLEYHGLLQNTADAFVKNTGNNVNPAPGAISNSNPNDLLIAAFCQGTSNIASEAIDSGFTLRGGNLGGIPTEAIGVADKISSTAETPVFTIDTATPWSAIGISFKSSPVTAGGGLLLPSLMNGITTGGPFFRNPIG